MPVPAAKKKTVPAKSGTKTVPGKGAKKITRYADRPLKYPFYQVLLCCAHRDDHFEYIDDPFADDPKGDPDLLSDPKNRRPLPIREGEDNCYDGPITADTAKKLLHWETEPDFKRRKMDEDPNHDPKGLSFGAEFLLTDSEKNKVMCWNNATEGYMNRPFDINHAKSLAQDVLTKNWRVNEENIIISKTGLVISGQHRLIGLILAVEEWKKNFEHWKDNWPTEPVMESFIAFGMDEDPATIHTIDNVKPRSLGDVFYTMPIFSDMGKDDRVEMTRMLSYAVTLLWKRTGGGRKMEGGERTGGDSDHYINYMTHSAAIDFLDRHEKLYDAVKFIYQEDGAKQKGQFTGDEPAAPQSEEEKEKFRGKKISGVLKIQRGHAAALLYLMGQSATPEARADEYYTYGGNKSEKRLDWKRWKQACEFWSELAAQELPWTKMVKDSLANLNDTEKDHEANAMERNCVIVNAWNKYKIEEPFAYEYPNTLHPEFTFGTDNTRSVLPQHEPWLGGIDKGTVDEKSVKQTKEEAEKAKTAAREEKIAKDIARGRTVLGADTNKKVAPAKGNGNGKGKPGAKKPAKKPVLAGGLGHVEEPSDE
jgi:hypothetical protein